MMHLLELLQSVLPMESGYVCKLTDSIQSAQYDLLPDASTYRDGQYELDADAEQHNLSNFPLEPDQPKAVLPINSLFVQDDVKSIVIYRIDQALPVTRIELLTPASKSPGSHYHPYLIQRTHALREGIHLVEIDYLHERRSPVLEIPDYTRHEDGAYPYGITVSRLLSSGGPGYTKFYGFHVEDPIPIIALPLGGQDILTYDFGEVYHTTFNTNPLNGLRHVNYAELPEGFETYSPIDQERIKVRMELVRNAHA